jgi:hypothetical protein
MLAQTITCDVEFIGGPLDGHVELMNMPLRAFIGVRVMSVSSLASFLRKWLTRNSTAVSIYELGNNGSRIHYRFLRSQLVVPELPNEARLIRTWVSIPLGGIQ